MRHVNLFLSIWCLVLLIISPSFGQTESLDSAKDSSDRTLVTKGRVTAFKSALDADNLKITQGRLILPQTLDLACQGVIISCNGNNSTNPYLIASVPPVGYTSSENPPLSFYMRPDEAIVIIGRTPPPVSYFSFRSFVFNRWVAQEDIRHKMFNSLGDPHNMLTLQTTGDQAGNPYDQGYVLISVADKGTEDRIRKALKSAGIPDKIINTDVISPNIVKLSSNIDTTKDDSLIILHRMAIWQYGYEQAGQDYLDNPTAYVFRVTPDPKTDKANYSPLPVEKLRPRGTGQTEMDLTPEVETLRQAIVAKYPGTSADELKPAIWLEESLDAFQRNVDTLGESRDTVYLRNEGNFNLADDEFLIVYGVNHEATGKATYASFTVYDVCKACGVEGENSRMLAGSALDYFTGNPNIPTHVDKLYAWKVARDCKGDPHCTTVQTGGCPLAIEKTGQMFIGFRAYVEPATKIGPAFTEIIFDRVIRFSPTGPVISKIAVASKPFVSTDPPPSVPAGTQVNISFHVSGAETSAGTWTARLKTDDGCGVLTPSSGVVAGGSGDVSFTITPPPTQKTILTVFLDATDGKGRRAKTQGVQVQFVQPK
ncbi:MAG: hypothetical protein HQK59_16420 [Deltaproteobacteria bacterium]|nr:hypothetical protein [Deltaproteobacteria bacterium]